MDNVVELKQVNKIYGEEIKTQVLYDVDLSVPKGAFQSIVGASGSGKSTLLNIIGTLDRATSGDVWIGGENTKDFSGKALANLRNRTIGFIFQFHYLLNEFSALENVLIPYMINQGKPSKEALQRAEELLELVGLSKVKNNLASKMSGGQQQRTAIARALMNSPKLILADEPTGNLDSESSEGVYEIFRKVNKLDKTTFLIVTHDERIAQKTDKIIEVKDGRIL
jgi:lipoprotein-releasing system ATP-binding protein